MKAFSRISDNTGINKKMALEAFWDNKHLLL